MTKTTRKGRGFENEVVNSHKKVDVQAKRVPRSGAIEGFEGDVYLYPSTIGKLRAECKVRRNASGFKTIERWMGSMDVIFLKRDYAEPMVCVHMNLWLDLLANLERVNDKKESDEGST